MVTTKDSIIVEMLAGKNTVLPELQKIRKLAGDAAFAQKAGLDGASKSMKNFKSHLQKGSVYMKAFDEGLKDVNHRFDMNILSWMFGGMALQRVGLMMTRFLIPGMDKLEKLNTAGAKKVRGMTAAFEFLKISIFETLSNTPLFKKFVEWVIKGAMWIAEFAQKHPDITAIAAAISGIAVVLGTLAIGVGIFGQLKHLITLLGLGGVAGEVGSVTKAFKVWNTLKFAPLLGQIALISGAVVVAGAALLKYFDDINKMTASLTEQNAPKLEESYLAGADNGQELINNFENFNLEWSNLRAGIDRTIGVQTIFNSTTGEFNKHIITAQDEMSGLNSNVQMMLETGQLFDEQLRNNNINSVNEFTVALNNIPKEINTVVKTTYVTEGSGGNNGYTQSAGEYLSSFGR